MAWLAVLINTDKNAVMVFCTFINQSLINKVFNNISVNKSCLKQIRKYLKVLKFGGLGKRFMENKDINTTLIHLVDDKRFRKKIFHSYWTNSWNLDLDDNGASILPTVLRSVIKKAKWNRKIRMMLPDILAYADKTSLDDENFKMLLKFKGDFRNTCLSQIGHLELPFYQMYILNKYPLGYEAFCRLFDNICHYECFTEEDMLRILENNYDVRVFAISDCIKSAQEKYGDSDKLCVAKKWLNELPQSSRHYMK